MVLATDMAEHFSQLNEIKNTIAKTEAKTLKQIATGEVPYPEQLEKPKIMALMIHAADISNALKPWSFSHYSTMQLLQEFFTQGDMSKMNRMAPAVLCDRKTTNIPNSQINFSRVLVLPTFELLNNTVKLLAEHFLPVSGFNNLNSSYLNNQIVLSESTGKGKRNLHIRHDTRFARRATIAT